MPIIKELIDGEIREVEMTFAPVVEPVPQVVSRFQGEAVLLTDGHLDTVEALIAQADPLTQLAWKRATEFRRNSPMIAQISNVLGWTSEYVDSLFTRAALIEA